MKIRNLLIGVVVGVAVSFPFAAGFSSDAGTNQDPLVTLSYVDSQIENLRMELKALVDQSPAGGYVILENLSAGTKVTFGKNAEVILRSGGGTIVVGANGDGFSDLTDGIDLREGAVPKNHLLLVARDDGRGINVTSNGTYIMVKGTYKIN